MLRVTVEMVPFGVESRKHTIGQLLLINNATGTIDTGNYDIELRTYKQNGKESLSKTKIKNFPRTVFGAWDLIYRALKTFVGEANDSY